MTLAELAAALEPVAVENLDADTAPAQLRARRVLRVTRDSRQADADTAFVAIRGASLDGRRFVPGLAAAAVITDGPVQADPGVPVLRVKDTRLALALAAAALAGQPSHRLPVVGITGTNGKTTVSFMLEAIAAHASRTVGVIGTTGHRIGAERVPDHFTTPEAPVLQDLLRRMADAGCALCAMEVSSIGLALRRVDGTRFAVAVFTSFSQDHLDFHGSMRSYLDAKLRLFSELLADQGTAVVHGDDPVAGEVVAAAGARRVWTYGRGQRHDIQATDVVLTLRGATANVVTPLGTGTLRLPLPGAHNVDNALAALGAAMALGIDLDVALGGLAGLSGVPGRFEPVLDPSGQRTVLVDYAHTPDALEQALGTLRALNPAQLLLVFGCGGDRDASKRPEMGRVAAACADVVWLTNDNPRSEDPLAILAAIQAGVPSDATVQVEPDRAVAIHAAIEEAGPGDVVLIAGKGHETTQTIGDQVLPFDDRLVAAAALAAHPLAGGAP